MKSRRGIGMLVQRYCATTSTLYLGNGVNDDIICVIANELAKPLSQPSTNQPTVSSAVPENSADRYYWSIICHSSSDKLFDLFMLHHGSIGFYKVHLRKM